MKNGIKKSVSSICRKASLLRRGPKIAVVVGVWLVVITLLLAFGL